MFQNLLTAPLCVALLAASLCAAESEQPVGASSVVVKGAQVRIIQEVELAARESGLIAEVYFKPGQFVEAGTVMAKLDDTQAQLKANEAQIEFAKSLENARSDVEIRAARKSLDVAKAELLRAQEAVEQYAKSISKTEIDRLRLTTERAALFIEQAELMARVAQLDSDLRKNQVAFAQHTLERHRVRTSISGIVVQVNFQDGEWVETGTTIVRVLRLDRLRCEGRIDASLVDLTMVGRPVRITVQRPMRDAVTVTGTLTFVDPQINAIKKDVLVGAEFDNPKFVILPGMTAEIEISGSNDLAKKSETPATESEIN